MRAPSSCRHGRHMSFSALYHTHFWFPGFQVSRFPCILCFHVSTFLYSFHDAHIVHTSHAFMPLATSLPTLIYNWCLSFSLPQPTLAISTRSPMSLFGLRFWLGKVDCVFVLDNLNFQAAPFSFSFSFFLFFFLLFFFYFRVLLI